MQLNTQLVMRKTVKQQKFQLVDTEYRQRTKSTNAPSLVIIDYRSLAYILFVQVIHLPKKVLLVLI
jgi:hypothetical protein